DDQPTRCPGFPAAQRSLCGEFDEFDAEHQSSWRGILTVEKMPMHPERDVVSMPTISTEVTTSWRHGLPTLSGGQVVLRELRGSDALSLHALLSPDEVARFISTPPSTVEGFEKFIAWTHRQRAAGAYVCFAVTLRGYDTAIGIFQVRDLGQDFQT